VATGSVTAASTLPDSPLRPEVRWLPAAGARSYVLEMVPCDDLEVAHCDFTAPPVRVVTDEATLSARPAAELVVATDAPVGQRYAFRVSSCAEAAGVDCVPSAPRYVDVGRIRQDVDGDGMGDLFLVADEGEGVSSLWRSASLGSYRANEISLSREDIRAVGWIGDYDADGFAELAVGAPAAGGGAWVYLAELAESGAGEEATAGAELGREIVGLDDVDGDGYADFAVTAPGLAQVRVQLGGEAFDAGRYILVEATVGVSEFPMAVASAGDRDSDGLADLAVLSRLDALHARVHVFSLAGRVATLLESHDIETGETSGEIDDPIALGRAVDADGDGVPDIPLGRRSTNQIIVIFADVLFESGVFTDGGVGTSVYGGDLDGTGYGRIVAGAPLISGFMGVTGASFHLRWSAGELTGVQMNYWNPEGFGQRVCAVDLDGDGREDIVAMGTSATSVGLFSDDRVGNTAYFILADSSIDRWIDVSR